MKILGILASAIVVALLASCNKQSETILSPGGVHAGTVHMSFVRAPAGIVQVIATLSRTGYDNRILHLSVADSGKVAAGSFSSVPVGTWHLEVDALNDTGAVQYSGEADLDVLPDQTTQVSLELLSTTGGIDIVVTWGAVCTPASSGLVSWWQGEGNANDRIGGNNGTLVGGVAFAPGRVGEAFKFDGISSYVRVHNSSSLNAPGSLTVEAWIYPTADTLAMIIGKWGFSYGWENQRSYSFDLWPGRALNFGIADDSTQEDTAFQDFRTGAGVLTLNAWNHVAAVYDKDAGARSIYVNGVKVAERFHAHIQITQGIADLAIGAYLYSPYYTWDPFPGLIDEVGFYQRALSGSEIAAIYNAGSAGKCR